ncbi:hypothetical protein Ac2012v2_000780 [Leucoagaricus gongylophorus]
MAPSHTSVTATSTFYMKYADTTDSFDHDPALYKRKVPRLAYSADVKTFNNCYNHATPSLTPSFTQMEVDGGIMCHPHIANPRLKRSLGEDLEIDYSNEHHSLDPAYSVLLPASPIDFSTTTYTVGLPSSSEQFPSYPQCMYDTRPQKTHDSRLPPSSVYPSPPQSTMASPLEISNPLPIQPSPSLPLYQPRPTRRIPIVSLSQLASAAEEMENNSLWQANLHKGSLDVKSRTLGASQDRMTERLIQCSCGCIESRCW